MPHVLLAFLVACCPPPEPPRGPSPWEPLPLPETAAGKTLHGVTFLDAQVGWIVGNQGLCLQTQDGGRTWKAIDLATKATLRTVRFLDRSTGVIAGDGDPDAPAPRGHIVMSRAMHSATVFWTLDGGQTWKKGTLLTNFEIHCVQAAGGPLQFGISGGEDHLDGDILRTASGVKDWDGKSVQSRRCFRALLDIRAVDAKRWIAVGSPVSVGFTPPPTDVLYTRAPCRALFSDDGGESWGPSEGSDGPACLRALVSGKDGERVLAVGDAGTVLASEDKGETWRALKSGCESDLLAAARAEANPKVIVAVGDKETTLVSSDRGDTWKRISWGETGAYLSVASAGDSFVAVGENGLARRARMKSLQEAKAVSPPPAPPKPAPKAATKAQLERVRVGDALTYQLDSEGPAKSSSVQEYRIKAVTPTGYTIEGEVVQGTPPAGLPKQWTMEVHFGDLPDYSTWKIGEAKEDKSKFGTQVTTRLPDEQIQIGEKRWDCVVVQINMASAGGGATVVSKNWIAKSTEVPHTGVVQQQVTQEMQSPQGKMTISQSMKLVSFARGKG